MAGEGGGPAGAPRRRGGGAGGGADGGTGRRPPRVGTILLWMVLMGLPFVIASQLLHASLDLATPGDQPGGEIAGRVVAEEDGRPLTQVPVELRLARGEESTPVLETRTDADGRFRFDAPAHKGYYRVHLGGGSLRRVVRSFSFLDQDEPLEVELGPGATLAIRLDRDGGGRIPGGTLYMEARLGGGGMSIFKPTLRMEQRFEGSAVRIDGLPPLHGKLRIELDGGERIELEFDLEEGQQRELAYSI